MSFNFDVNPAECERLLSENSKVIVAFCDPECEECAVMRPIFLSLVGDYDSDICFITFNLKKNAENKIYASKFGVIKEAPTFVTFVNGDIDAVKSRLLDRSDLVDMIADMLKVIDE
jgi:thiol-disulfide isomerase/thioredoxin